MFQPKRLLVQPPHFWFKPDFRCKAARCVELTNEPEYQNWKENPNSDNLAALKAMIGDNRQNMQSERYKFLPGTFFLPDLIVDFQHLKALPCNELDRLEVITSLDSPYAESVLARFARYYGRLGTPDIDKQVVLSRLQSSVENERR